MNPTGFGRLTGVPHDIHLVSVNWNETREGGWPWALDNQFRNARSGGYRLMIHLAPNTNSGAEGRSPGGVARGLSDRYLIAFGAYVNESNQYVYVRPPAEMNGHWSSWAAYNKNGSRRNADHSTTNYRKAFIRMALIVKGGDVATINASLRRNGMPALKTSATTLRRSGRVATVFNPQARGAPDVRGNQPWDYYPGKYVVDYVANDLYVQGGRAAWAAHDALYARYAKVHPFIVAEYAPWGYDDPAFVKRMFQWVAARPRTVALMYFNGTGANTFFLSKKPRSLAAYKAQAKAARFRCPAITGSWNSCAAPPATQDPSTQTE